MAPESHWRSVVENALRIQTANTSNKKEKSNAKFIAAVTKHNAYQVCESAASTVPFLYPSSWLQSPIVRLDVGQQQDGPGMGVFGGRRTLCHTY